MKRKILFVCIHNSARSQMAEAFVKSQCGNVFDTYSAGLDPGKLNPVVVEVMRERGIDISGNETKSVADMLATKMTFDFVVTVCDEASAERCPVFPGPTRRLHWGFPDPSSFQGTPEAKLQSTRDVRDQIEKRIAEWCAQECSQGTA